IPSAEQKTSVDRYARRHLGRTKLQGHLLWRRRVVAARVRVNGGVVHIVEQKIRTKLELAGRREQLPERVVIRAAGGERAGDGGIDVWQPAGPTAGRAGPFGLHAALVVREIDLPAVHRERQRVVDGVVLGGGGEDDGAAVAGNADAIDCQV